MAVRIGVVGHRSDPQVVRLAVCLEERGAQPFPFDLSDIPAHIAFHWSGDELAFGDEDLASLDAIYARTAYFPMPTFAPGKSREENEVLTFPIRENGSLMNTIISELGERLPMVNSPLCHRFHRQKPFMYRTLQRAGVPVPEFEVGCDLAKAAYFVDGLDEHVVVKPLMGGEVFLADLAYLKENHEEIDRRPLLLQRRIIGRSLRAYVVDSRVVAAAEIVHGDVIDWRSDVQSIDEVELSSRAEEAIARAPAALGLLFAAVDVEEEGGADGDPWVIDVNPGPMFAGFEAQSGTDVAGPLADYLIELASRAE